MLMITARMIGGPLYLVMIEEMDKELTKIIKDFDCALNFEALHIANETSKLSFSQSINSRSSGIWCRMRRANGVRTSGDRASRARASRARAFIQAS